MNHRLFAGIDTSCYTTSVACVNATGIVYDKRTVLSVRLGERGLRQSEALFQHIRNMDLLLPNMLRELDAQSVSAIAVSSRPRPDDRSYMPVFLAGQSFGRVAAAALKVPLYRFSHQEGHVRAALHGNETLSLHPFIALHLSGGTTEILLVRPGARFKLVGGTSDLHAGQFVDRVGVALGLKFPAGPGLEKIAKNVKTTDADITLPVSVNGLSCSFSGAETAAQRLICSGCASEVIAAAVYDCLARTVYKLIDNAAEATGVGEFLIGGGVASSALLRSTIEYRQLKRAKAFRINYAQPELSGDNAVGAAFLAKEAFENGVPAGKDDLF